MQVQANTDSIIKQLAYVILNMFIFSEKMEESHETHRHACIFVNNSSEILANM
jgi:hypothetical protein